MKIECPHEAPCCGNALIALDVRGALGLKRDRVAAALARVPALAESPALELASCLAAPSPTGYRSVAICAVGPAPEAGRSLVGVRDARGRVVDLPQCRVVARPVARRLDELRARVTPGLREVTVRSGTGKEPEAQVLLITEQGRRRLGAERLPVTLGGVAFALSPETPMPPNLGQVEREATVAADWLRPAADARAPFLAVHAGAGLHALLVARALSAPAILLEESAAAVDDARAAIEAAGLAVEARAVAPVAELARLADPRRGAVAPFAALLVHVPARGLAAEALAPLAALLAPGGRAALLADDPDRLAAALGALRLLGLRTARVVPVDAEPGTDRVHAVALVERAARAWEPPRLYEDDACLVLAKPGGIASTGADSLDALLLAAAGGERRLWPAHRLDAGTSGAILFARTKEAARTLGDAFAASEVERHYVVLAAGHTGAAGTIDTPLPEPGEPDKVLSAVTRWTRRETVGAHTLLDVQVETGRTHQIRRHLAAAHHPVVGDGRYGDPAANRAAAARAALDRPFVHASLLGFRSPATGERVTVEAPLPADLAYALARLA